MNEVVDLSFVDRIPDERLNAIIQRRKRMEDTFREGFQQMIKHLHNDAESARDYVQDIMRVSHADAQKEIEQLDNFINDICLMVILLKRERNRRGVVPTQFWQDEQE